MIVILLNVLELAKDIKIRQELLQIWQKLILTLYIAHMDG